MDRFHYYDAWSLYKPRSFRKKQTFSPTNWIFMNTKFVLHKYPREWLIILKMNPVVKQGSLFSQPETLEHWVCSVVMWSFHVERFHKFYLNTWKKHTHIHSYGLFIFFWQTKEKQQEMEGE